MSLTALDWRTNCWVQNRVCCHGCLENGLCFWRASTTAGYWEVGSERCPFTSTIISFLLALLLGRGFLIHSACTALNLDINWKLSHRVPCCSWRGSSFSGNRILRASTIATVLLLAWYILDWTFTSIALEFLVFVICFIETFRISFDSVMKLRENENVCIQTWVGSSSMR